MIEATEDTGHLKLMHDLEALREDAGRYLFHDFKSSLSVPKMDLMFRLQSLIDLVKSGRYDN